MCILAIEKELKPVDTAVSAELLREEATRVWALQKQEVIRGIWFTRRDRSAVIMLECADENEAMRQLASLPLVREGFITFEVHALQPYDGFDRLMAGNRTEPGHD